MEKMKFVKLIWRGETVKFYKADDGWYQGERGTKVENCFVEYQIDSNSWMALYSFSNEEIHGEKINESIPKRGLMQKALNSLQDEIDEFAKDLP